MSRTLPLDQFLKQYGEGRNQDACEEIFTRFVRRLTNFASRQFDSSIRFQADPEGVVQSVYRSFFARDLKSYKLENWESLWKLLTVITLRKCWKIRTKVRKNPTISTTAGWNGEGELSDSAEYMAAIDREPTPAEAAALTETVSQLFLAYKGKDREMAEAVLQGYTATEISERFGCSDRTVRRLRDDMRERLLGVSAEFVRGS